MTHDEVVQQAQQLANEASALADAFRPRSSDGVVIPVPMAKCLHLAEVLQQMSDIMVAIANDMDRVEEEFGMDRDRE